MAITVQIDEDKLKDMLMDRVEFWTTDSDVTELYRKFYSRQVDGGAFEGAVLDIGATVDNDYINYYSIVCKEDYTETDWERLLEHYRDGDYVRNVELEDGNTFGYDQIVEVTDNEDYMLVTA